jgi:hypothetical protein
MGANCQRYPNELHIAEITILNPRNSIKYYCTDSERTSALDIL